MKNRFLALTLLFGLTALFAQAQNTDSKYYELRIYYCNEGKLDALIQRFQNHTLALFEKHGFENIGYWLPVQNDKNALYYIIAAPSKEAHAKTWKDFLADPEWQAAAKKSEENGKILSGIESIILDVADDISPKVQSSVSNTDRIFELRTYYCFPGKLPNLITRFKDHTLKLFEKHGMTNLPYWTTVEKDGSQGKLVYLLAHKSVDDAKASFKSFGSDPEWVKVRDASEAGGKIVEKVESVYLKALPFSKIR